MRVPGRGQDTSAVNDQDACRNSRARARSTDYAPGMETRERCGAAKSDDLSARGNRPNSRGAKSRPRIVRGSLSNRTQQDGTAHDISADDWSALMALAQQGDNTAYRRLLTEMTPYLRRFATSRLSGSANVEDAVQDILLTVHRLRHTYDPRRPIGPWLVTIAKRRVIDRFRRMRRQGTRETVLTPEHETFAVDQANRFEESSDRYALRKAIDALPPGQREAIRRLKLEEMSLKEASEATGMSISALKVATHRALKNLKRMIAGRND